MSAGCAAVAIVVLAAVVVHARANWGPTTTDQVGQPATDVVIGLRWDSTGGDRVRAR